MIQPIYSKWRRVSKLFAAFLFLTLLFTNCKKKDTTLGSSAFDPSELLAAGAVDTFTINTYTIIEDSINTRNPIYNLLGEMNDPIFGKISTSFYTQVRLVSANPEFGDLSQIILDSFVLSMDFADHTGNYSEQTFEVYELDADISADTAVKFYEFSALNTKPTNLVAPGKGTFKPDPFGNAIVDTLSVDPQMRLSLDTNFAKLLIQEANSGTAFASNDNFINFFKGFQIKTNNPAQVAGQGAIYSLDMRSAASKLTIYYRRLQDVNGVPTYVVKNYDFVINENCQSFNHVEFDRSGTKVDAADGNKVSGNTEFYAQALGVRAVIEIPGLSNLPKTALIHKAILDLPIQYQTASIYNPGLKVILSGRENNDPKQSYYINTSTPTTAISDYTKSVNADIRQFVQSIATGVIENTPIYISPLRSVISMDRIIFNGRNTSNKMKPKLYVIYTEF
ncbi:MAG: DUF4270 family protein [Crocinitomicaceae bacterium]